MLNILYRVTLLVVLSAFVTQTKAQITFLENKGQWENTIKYRAEIPGGLLFLEDGRLSYLLHEAEPFRILHHEGKYDKPVQMHYFRVVFEGSNKNLQYQPEQQTSAYYNFFLGNDPKKWATGVNGFFKITVKELYPGIDLELYGSNNNAIKYNLIVKPGADPKMIKVKYEGLDDISLAGGRLNLKTSVGELSELPPICYQLNDTAVKYVKTVYSLKDNILTFDIKEHYNNRKNFIIDPELVFCTYSGAFGDNWGFTGTYDNSGNGYSGGASYSYFGSNGSFPVTPGAFQTNFRDGVEGTNEDLARDAAIYKVSKDGRQLMFATYLGGTHNEEPHSMIVNSKNELIVFGTTFSVDFPVSGFDNGFNGQADVFVFVLSADGKSMVGSTFMGGTGIDGLNGDANPGNSPLAYNYGDQYRGEVITDAADNIYVATCTQSSFGFPFSGTLQTNFGGTQDGLIFKLSPNAGSLTWGTYLGGNGWDVCNGIDLDLNGNVLAAGGTTAGIPWITTGKGEVTSLQGGTSDGFIIKLSPDGTTLSNGTYLGTGGYDQAYFVKIDKFNHPYVTGQTAGNWPVSTQIFTEPGGGQFICKFTPDLVTRERSMVFGKGTIKPQITLSAFLVDECERVFVSGWGGEVNRPALGGHGGNTAQMSKTPDAYQLNTDGSDFYLAVFSKNLDELTYATFLGGIGSDEHVDGGTSRFDRKGIVYQSICAGCGANSLMQASNGAFGPKNNSNNCNNAIIKLDFENLNRAPVVNDAFYSVVAGNPLIFNIDATDADKYDTLTLEIDETAFVHGFPGAKPTITKPGKGLRQLQANFSWNPGCEHVTGDTIVIPVKLTDQGCPDSKSDTAVIKILVLPPPVIPPPGVLCVVPETPTSIKLRWDNADTANPFFSHFIIVKTDPAGNVSNLGPFTKKDKFEYIDNAVSDYRNKNYCYYIYSVNTCEVKGADSYTICTKDQFNAPIKSTEVVTVTVVDNKDVKLVWKDTKEDDFESYLVYRAPKQSPDINSYQFYGSSNKTDDTTFIDTKVDVSKDAYCYKLQVIDQCGHISQFSNRGCNIVLTGASKPYEHDLTWDTYNDWAVGVDNYELIRWDTRQNPATNYQGPPIVLNHMDDQFDYDYGIYWYKIVATESGGNNATSESNTVKLVQKPLLHVPTAFTPNGDKLNDGWGQVDVFVKDYHMQVFNRWGEKVFESFDKNEQWTGDFKRTGPADNVFIWIVRYTGWDNSIHHQKGNVTILN